MNKDKILFIYKKPTTFVRTDFKLLEQNFEITSLQFYPYKTKFQILYNLLKQFVFLLFHIRQYKLIYIWFADYHAFIPIHFARLFKIQSFLVVGGFDVARIPELNYGVFCNKLRGYLCISAMKKVHMNLSVSKYVDRKIKAITHKRNSTLLYNCIDLTSDKLPNLKKENLIITVGVIDSVQTYLIKGIDTFIEAARIQPHYEFLIIGLNLSVIEELQIKVPDNVQVLPKVEHKELIAYYQKAKVYCQLSRSESFGVALAESIYYGCIPVITNVGGMKEVINEKGVIVERNASFIADELEKIIKSNVSPESYFIHPNFTLQERQKNLLKIFSI